MASVIAGATDEIVERFRSALDELERERPGATAVLFRDSPGIVKVRVLDERFKGLRRAERHDQVWDFLRDRVGDDAMEQLYVLLLLTPAEADSSMANFEFEHPIPIDQL